MIGLSLTSNSKLVGALFQYLLKLKKMGGGGSWELSSDSKLVWYMGDSQYLEL